jgi:ribosomal protein L40E
MKPSSTVVSVSSVQTESSTVSPQMTFLGMNWPYIVAGLVVLAIVGILLGRKRAKTPSLAPVSDAVSDVLCTECGAENPTTNEFCGRCGKRLVARPTSQK